MECSRSHHENIIPHSHRFDFHCTVLCGVVSNLIWTPSSKGDEYQSTVMHYAGAPGKYRRGDTERSTYTNTVKKYDAGDKYAMEASQIHSIYFERGTVVLFLEGETVTDTSVILEPVVNGIVVPTFDVKEWMFQRDPDIPEVSVD
jgi:hypothetical protein